MKKLSESTGLLCNHTAWDVCSGKYLFERLPSLKRLFVPEHGLFAELQDQVPLTDTDGYRDFGIEAEVVLLYGGDEKSLRVESRHLEDLELLVIDLQDVGSRYFTYAVTMSYMLEAVQKFAPDLEVMIIDRENPAGLQVEGSLLMREYESFVGRAGLPHRHGLTIAELALFFHRQMNASFSLSILTLKGKKLRTNLPEQVSILNQNKIMEISDHEFWLIPPSPNMPGPVTPIIYSGQCLLEGTNISEGRGTTRPFEIFGAPWLKPVKLFRENQGFSDFKGARLRPLRFVPTFHKWAGLICEGFQLHLTGQPYHSLLHTLFMIRTIKEHFPQFTWREGPYEKVSDKTAIELLCADPVLLKYLEGSGEFKDVKDYLRDCEENWILSMGSYSLYNREHFSIL